MASKQLGKLRQWAGEVISREKTTVVTEEFRELERDIELRRDGLQHLQAVSEGYHRALSKKKDSEAVNENEKLLPIDSLGVVMITHGEEFGETSAFGTSLVKLGRAHCQIATLQEAYALAFEDTFLTSLQKLAEDIKDYEHQRKKLESRRLSYDAAITKLERVKTGKKPKEKDIKEAEDELQKARLRYEETSEDVQARMRGIQENEIEQFRDLTNFLHLEMNFVQQYMDVLKGVKKDWCDESSLLHVDNRKGNSQTHIFTRNMDDRKISTVQSKRSLTSVNSNYVSTSANGSEDEPITPVTARPTHHRQKSDSVSTSRPPSRPSSRASRKRSGSNATAGDDEKKDKAEKPGGRRMTVTGWASSITGRGKKGRDKFSVLRDDDDGGDQTDSDGGNLARSPSSRSLSSRRGSQSKSKENLANSSPKPPTRISKSSFQDKKVVRALYEFSGSSDELSFNVGDEIVVLNEVLDGWWMGELDGRKGLFPTPYTEVITLSSSKLYGPGGTTRGGAILSSRDDTSKQEITNDSRGYDDSKDNSHPFGDHGFTAMRTPTHTQFDAESVTSSAAEEEEERHLMPIKPVDEDIYTASIPREAPTLHRLITPKRSAPDIVVSGSSQKKVPPPPPPRRSTPNNLFPTPPIPERRPSSARSQSSSSLPRVSRERTPTSSISSFSHDTSPFESMTDLPAPVCHNFKQNPFKPKGMCSNCFQLHA